MLTPDELKALVALLNKAAALGLYNDAEALTARQLIAKLSPPQEAKE